MMLQTVPLGAAEVVVGVGVIEESIGNEEGPYGQALEIAGKLVKA